MKALLGKIRLSRKLVIMLFGGVAILCGATGAAAVFIGRDALLGPPKEQVNGLSCQLVQTAVIKREDRYWIRKYISTAPTDGITRLRTALRVAKVVAEKDKPDLVQVVVVAENGPKDRSAIRGRAIGADVIYEPNPGRIPDRAEREPLTARYIDREANAEGDFYGDSVALPMSDAEAIMAKLSPELDCIDPNDKVLEATGHEAKKPEKGAKGEKASGHEGGSKKGDHGGEAANGHGASSDAHGAPAGASDTQGHDSQAKAGAHDANGTDSHGSAPAAAEAPGLIASVKGMIFGAPKVAAPAVGPADPHAAPHDAPTADGHGVTPAATSGGAEHAANGPSASDHVAPDPAVADAAHVPAPQQVAAHAADVQQEKSTQGWIGRLKSMAFGDSKPEAAKTPDVAADNHTAAPSQQADAAHAEAGSSPQTHDAGDNGSGAKPLVVKSDSADPPSVLPRGITLR